MSRISHQGNDTAAAHAQRTAETQQKAANAQGARNGAQFAALYRGSTNFTYGGDAQRGPSVSSVRAKRMADQLARKRRAAKKQRSNGASLEDDGPDDAEAHHAEGQKVNRDGGGRGGGGGHSQGEHGDDHGTSAAPGIKTRPERGAVPPPTGRLDAIAAQYSQPGQEGARAAAIRDAWRNDMLGLRDELAANPHAPLDARVFERSIDLLDVQQRIGSLAPVHAGGASNLSVLREHAGGAPAKGVTRLPSPERVQRFNLLFPLLWLHADKPSNAKQRARALDTLSGQRNGVLGRAASSGGAGSTEAGSQNAASDRSAAPPQASQARRAFPGGAR
ncbi:type III secretion regulatory protein HpaA [Paraburkholderia sp. GAS199]|uniref:hypothetical protein n=1 Tax=Paraburkholderia sp. GAS199 TaxID=3035126 RepID=UPI003D262D6A